MKKKANIVIAGLAGMFILTACSKRIKDDMVIEVSESNKQIENEVESLESEEIELTNIESQQNESDSKVNSIFGYSIDEYMDFLDSIDVQLADDPYYMKGIGQNTSRNYYIPVVFDINTITSDFIDLIEMYIQINDGILREVEYERFGEIWLLYFEMPESSIENIKLTVKLREDLQEVCDISREYSIGKLIEQSKLTWAPDYALNTDMLTKLDDGIVVSPELNINEYQTTIQEQTVKAYDITFKLYGYGAEYPDLNISKQCDVNIINGETNKIVELPNTENNLEDGVIYFRGEYTNDKEIKLHFYTLMDSSSIESIESAKRLITDFLGDNFLKIDYKGNSYLSSLNGAGIY